MIGPLTFLRTDKTPATGEPFQLRAGHPLAGELCPICGRDMVPGQYLTLLVLGPGYDPEARARALHGLVYNAEAVPVHHACTGRMDPELS